MAAQATSPSPDAVAPPRRGRFHDIGPRIASSAVLAPLGVAAVVAGEPWIAGATGAAVAAMSFEWARMSEPASRNSAFLFMLAGSLGAVMFASRAMMAAALGWLALCAVASAFRRPNWVARLETGLGALYVGAPCALFLWLRDRGGEGLHTILFLFAVIWAADVFAYLGGVTIGGPKLHSALSPQKTWSGVVAGALAGAAAGVLFGLAIAAPNLALIGLAGGALALIGLLGDLIESFLKRRFNVKDASGFIPGHGGVLDRIDGLMAATLVSAGVLALAPDAATRLFGIGR